ncbi:MAG: hypothetical protein IJY57_01290 [Clostridia bacterium]|nr:hypothetical protein [Clostridia bacterium]
MDDKFLSGIILGMLGGALIVTNSVKARQMVKDGQTQVKEKITEITEKDKKKKS